MKRFYSILSICLVALILSNQGCEKTSGVCSKNYDFSKSWLTQEIDKHQAEIDYSITFEYISTDMYEKQGNVFYLMNYYDLIDGVKVYELFDCSGEQVEFFELQEFQQIISEYTFVRQIH